MLLSTVEVGMYVGVERSSLDAAYRVRHLLHTFERLVSVLEALLAHQRQPNNTRLLSFVSSSSTNSSSSSRRRRRRRKKRTTTTSRTKIIRLITRKCKFYVLYAPSVYNDDCVYQSRKAEPMYKIAVK